MPLSKLARGAVLAAALASAGAVAPSAARPASTQSGMIALDVDKAQLFQIAGVAKTVFVANPELADIQVPTPATFLIYGKKAGNTTVFVITEAGVISSYAVRVSRPTADIAAAIRSAVPQAEVKVSSTPAGVTIAGSVATPLDAERLRNAAKSYLGDKETINFDVSVRAAVQVTLHVRVAEVSRNIDKQLGVNWQSLFNSSTLAVGLLSGGTSISAIGSSISSGANYGAAYAGYTSKSGKVNVDAVIDALDEYGLATILAEPTLTAISGETANFLAGGEYPIPVPQNYQVVTIDYKHYGISVDFTPTVLDGNRISVKVRPEVSALTTVGSVTIDNIAVPALTIRRAETTVELGSGESFAVAGLFQNNSSNQVQGLPWLADVPILGALFRSSSFLRNESELVIIVTPYIVKPVSSPSDLHVPTEGFAFSSDLERILSGRLTAGRAPGADISARRPGQPHLHGAAGFMLE